MRYSGPIHGLIKFLDRTYLDDFLSGSLYMNTLQYFAEQETSDPSAEVRGDSWEGMARALGITSMKVRIDSVYIPIAGIDHQLPWCQSGGIRANVFCMYALAENWTPPVDEENFKFGDIFACITNVGEFFRRLKAAEKTCEYRLLCDLVEYFPQTYQGEVGIFKKRSQFQYQSELRIAVDPGPGQPYRLEIGDLSDIVVTGALREINECLRWPAQ
jgi:hypothetical protein